MLDKIVVVADGAVLQSLGHDLNELFDRDGLVRVHVELLSDLKQLDRVEVLKKLHFVAIRGVDVTHFDVVAC